MARIRIYQSFFNSPPLQRPDVRGIPLENKADVRQRLPQLDSVVNASGLSYAFPLSRTQVLGTPLEDKADVRQRLPSLDGVVNASGLYYPFPLSRTQVLGAPLVASADVRLRLPQLDSVVNASGSNGPELWNSPVTVAIDATLGWMGGSPTPQYKLPCFKGAINASGANGPELWNPPTTVSAVTSGWEFQSPVLKQSKKEFGPTVLHIGTSETAADAIGWSIVLPDLPTRRRQTPLAIFDSLSLPLVLETPPQSTTVSLAELKRVRSRIGFADAAVDSQSWSPLESVAAQPWGWSLPPPRGRVVPESVFAGPTLAPQAIDSVAVGWSVVLPSLPQFRRKQAPPESTPRLDRPSAIASATSLGWICELPLTRRVPPRAGVFAGADLAPQAINPSPYGWTVTTNDLPAFRRKQALPELAGRLDQPTDLITGWSIVEPDLPQFMRKQALPETTARIDQPSGLDAALSLGWVAVIPDLPQFQRRQAFPELSGRVDQPTDDVVVGWSVVTPDLLQTRKRPALTEIAGRIDTPVVVVQATGGWEVDPPALRRARPISGGIFAGASHDPQIAPSTTPAATARQQTYFIANVGRFMRRG